MALIYTIQNWLLFKIFNHKLYFFSHNYHFSSGFVKSNYVLCVKVLFWTLFYLFLTLFSHNLLQNTLKNDPKIVSIANVSRCFFFSFYFDLEGGVDAGVEYQTSNCNNHLFVYKLDPYFWGCALSARFTLWRVLNRTSFFFQKCIIENGTFWHVLMTSVL